MKQKAFNVMCVLVDRDRGKAFKILKELVQESEFNEHLLDALAELPDSKNLSRVSKHVALFIKELSLQNTD